MYGGDDGARTRDLCRDSEKEGRNLQKTSVTDGFFWRCKERSGTVIEPISNPRPLPCKPLPRLRLGLDECFVLGSMQPMSLAHTINSSMDRSQKRIALSIHPSALVLVPSPKRERYVKPILFEALRGVNLAG
jgi:hypothetical protein